MSVVDTARFMSLVGMAQIDALIAVFDAKYHYTLWRPITAIRNGDIDDNPATERVPTWQPINITPLHPEYPCAHCIVSGAVAGAITAILGTEEIPKVATTSPSAPGVTHTTPMCETSITRFLSRESLRGSTGGSRLSLVATWVGRSAPIPCRTVCSR